MRPNIILILMDDLGWRDLSCCGSQFYETPNLDRLAGHGMRFTDAYASCPVCSPSRASILSGKYPARVGVTDYIDWSKTWHPLRGRLIDAPYLDHLPQTEMCLARVLKENGYRTWHVGKWHLGGAGYYPQDHGFDLNIGGSEFGCPMNGYFDPWKLKNLPEGPNGQYLADGITEHAVRLINDRSDRPFFLNLWHYLVHTPIQGKPEYVERFAHKAKAMGLDKITPFEVGEYFPTEKLKHQRITRRLVQSDPAYAAMVYSMDESVGRICQALAETGQAGNTVIIFTSDNGGLATSESSPTTNKPLQEGKGWMYEGGTRVPLFVYWPGQVRAGSLCSVPVTGPDLYPTIMDAAGIPPLPSQHRDGVSLLPLLRETSTLNRDGLFWHYPHYGNQGGTPGASIRSGDYKLIEFFEDQHVELYNLREDIGEEHDLAGRETELAKTMRERLHAWQASVEAVWPQANPDFKPWPREAGAAKL